VRDAPHFEEVFDDWQFDLELLEDLVVAVLEVGLRVAQSRGGQHPVDLVDSIIEIELDLAAAHPARL